MYIAIAMFDVIIKYMYQNRKVKTSNVMHKMYLSS